MEDVSAEVKRIILTRKIEGIRNTVYDTTLDVRVADVLGNEQGKRQAEDNVRNLLKAIDFLEGELKELEDSEEGG